MDASIPGGKGRHCETQGRPGKGEGLGEAFIWGHCQRSQYARLVITKHPMLADATGAVIPPPSSPGKWTLRSKVPSTLERVSCTAAGAVDTLLLPLLHK